MTDLIRPVGGTRTQDFDGAYPAERPGYLRTDTTPHRGKRSPFAGAKFRRDLHLAIDYSVPVGTPVRAMATGPVVRQGISSPDGATYIQQRVHRGPNFDLHMLYYHLKAGSFKHRLGEVVQQGVDLALSGNTGWSSGPHLHVELVRLPRGTSPDQWYGALHLDPQPYINGTAHFATID
jgi:murein DD-endopeptidase MepM/ murein hydrolase activator NlpD